MSTSFSVYPTKDAIPSFRQLIDRTTDHLGALLASWGFTQRVPLTVTLWRTEPDRANVPIEMDSPFWWTWNGYAWFQVPGVAGGAVAYGYSMDDWDRESIEDTLFKEAPQFTEMATTALHIGRCWRCVRRAGQPAIIYAVYGMLAGSLAELTGGFIDSGDCAWDSRRLPALPGIFLSEYGRPNPNSSEKHRNWDKYFRERLQKELSEIQSAR